MSAKMVRDYLPSFIYQYTNGDEETQRLFRESYKEDPFKVVFLAHP